MALSCRIAAFLLALLYLAPLGERRAEAGEIPEYYRSARAQAMGGAYVGLADDEAAVYLNPAGLAGNKGFRFHYAPIDLTASSDVYLGTQDMVKAANKVSPQTLDVLIGRNMFTELQFAPVLVTDHFGISFLLDGQAAFLSRDKTWPQMTLGYQTTNGFQAGYGFTVANLFKRRGELRLGIGGKILWRRGGYHPLDLVQLMTVNRGTLTELNGNFERGMGVDLGSQYVHKVSSRLTVSAGTAFTNVGDVSFGPQADRIRGNLSTGVAATYNLRGSKVTATYDYQHILDQTDWRKKIHTGVELALPVISLYGGISQVSFTYGLAFDLWLFRITALSYAEEDGSFAGQDSYRRWTLKIDMKFDL